MENFTQTRYRLQRRCIECILEAASHNRQAGCRGAWCLLRQSFDESDADSAVAFHKARILICQQLSHCIISTIDVQMKFI